MINFKRRRTRSTRRARRKKEKQLTNKYQNSEQERKEGLRKTEGPYRGKGGRLSRRNSIENRDCIIERRSAKNLSARTWKSLHTRGRRSKNESTRGWRNKLLPREIGRSKMRRNKGLISR